MWFRLFTDSSWEEMGVGSHPMFSEGKSMRESTERWKKTLKYKRVGKNGKTETLNNPKCKHKPGVVTGNADFQGRLML